MNHFKTHGAISWPELMSNDPEASAKFYTSVFGWDCKVTPMATGDYTVAQVGGAGMAGIMKKPDPGHPTAWSFYVTVDDAKASLKKAVELGATTILETMDIPEVGIFCGIQDPQGAVILMMEYKEMEGAPEVDFTAGFVTHGAFSWFELRTPDPAAASEFYKQLFDWNISVDEMGMGPYYQIKVGDVGIGGIVQPPPGDTPPHWGAYVTVDDVDKSAEVAKESGGEVMFAMDIPNIGRFCMISDPEGAWLAAMQYVPMETA